MNFHEGEYLYINKPYGISSFGALAHIRYVVSKHLGVKRVKIGHAGTLDPLATGVLVLCTGKKTKEIESLQLHTKEYVAGVQFGCSTPSYDREHTVDHTYPKSHITRQLLEETLNTFEGDIMQAPPVYSAIKINGKRAYELGRAGRDVEIAAKPVHIDEIELLEFDDARMGKYPCGMRKRDIYPLSCQGHRRSHRQWSLSDITVQDTVRQCPH